MGHVVSYGAFRDGRLLPSEFLPSNCGGVRTCGVAVRACAIP